MPLAFIAQKIARSNGSELWNAALAWDSTVARSGLMWYNALPLTWWRMWSSKSWLDSHRSCILM